MDKRFINSFPRREAAGRSPFSSDRANLIYITIHRTRTARQGFQIEADGGLNGRRRAVTNGRTDGHYHPVLPWNDWEVTHCLSPSPMSL